MLDSEWGYIIESVKGKYPEKRSKYHNLIIGKRCIVPDHQDLLGCVCCMIIEPFGHHPSSRRFYTTEVLRSDKYDDGKIVMETLNSTYTFVPIQRGEDNDLSGQRC